MGSKTVLKGRDQVATLTIAARDGTATQFPHLYGPLPKRAVTSVVPYRPASDGVYREPVGLPAPTDRRARAFAFDRSLVERRAAVVVPVTSGVAVLDPRVPDSYEHNALWLAGDVPAATIVADADAVLAGCAHRRLVLDRTPPADLGWDVQELRVMVLDAAARVAADPTDVTVVPIMHEVAARLGDTMWRRDLPGVTDEVVEQLLRREGIADAHLEVVDLAVLGEGGVPLASAQLRIDGATASIEAVMAAPEARRRGYGHAVVGDAIRRAHGAGCDVIFLVADADDWPRRWYERLGFVDIGARWEATRRLRGE